MAAEDSLSGPQFYHPKEIGWIESRDYPGKLKDIKFAPGGESDKRVKAIMSTAKTEGIHEPVEVKRSGSRRWLHDGHHRYVAAKRLGIELPVKGYLD